MNDSCATGGAAEPDLSDTVTVAQALRRALILVVDDEPANVKLVQRMLASDSYANVIATTVPEQALELVRARPVDLVILDLNMPRLDGFAVMEELCARGAATAPPILMLTAQHAREPRVQALRNGARDYVTKPFDREELLARVRNLLEVQLFHKSARLRNDVLAEKVRERTEELYQTRLEIVHRLGRAAEYRDNETGLHIIRMSEISAVIAATSGMSAGECDLIMNASPMHDLGKIGIPDRILLKPGALDAAEWAVMQTHTGIGASILAGAGHELLHQASVIALCHHERWDGSGYPDALCGEAIPLVARIVAIADVFDALTSERPYKRAWSVDESLGYVRDNAGRHFDPTLVAHFLARFDDIVAISRRYADAAPGAATSTPQGRGPLAG
ncbi:MAG: response regulator [Gammaproteobacteria bacterium]|nr:response regulator [Gammaproteobacteria bacterium]